MKTIKEMIRGKNVTFEYYRDKELWYTTECGFKFPVPIEDTGTGVFKATEKAILLMRYIRKHTDFLIRQREQFEIDKRAALGG